MASFSPYQVDYSLKNTSKTFGFSKKRVSFKFGIANNEALGQGLTGANCRGSEHEIIFIWSLNSGKRQILADGKDVHYSESGQNGWTSDQVFQHQFNFRVPNFSSPLRCHLVTQPSNKDVPSIKAFDLRVNGLSFFSFPKIFQLGTAQMISRPVKGSGQASSNPEDDPYITPEERKAIAAAKLASMRDYREQQSNQRNGGGGGDDGNLINLMDDPAPAPSVPPPAAAYAASSVHSFGSAPPPQQTPPASYAQTPYSNYSLGAPPPMQPTQTQPAYGQPYGGQPSPAAYGQPSPSYGQQQQQQQQQPYYQQPQTTPTSQPYGAPMMSPSNGTAASYGSAPSFAMPPQQQQQYPPPQQQYPPQQPFGQY